MAFRSVFQFDRFGLFAPQLLLRLERQALASNLDSRRYSDMGTPSIRISVGFGGFGAGSMFIFPSKVQGSRTHPLFAGQFVADEQS